MKLHGLDINKLQNIGLLIIDLSEDWYLSFDHKDDRKIATIDNEKVIENWNNLIKQSINNGRKGLRVFSMLNCFFEYNLIDELIDYECVCSPKYNKPLLGLCAYSDKHIAQLSEDKIRRLVLSRNTVWI